MGIVTEEKIKQKKKWLKRFRKNQSCIIRLEKKLRDKDEQIKKIKSSNFSGMPRGSTPVTIEDLVSDKIDLEKRIERLKNKGKIFKDEILEEIDSLDDPRLCDVLESYCIDCLSIDDICDKEGYTERYVYSLYQKAISLLAESEQ